MRIYVEPDDQTLKEINQKAKETGIVKAQFLLEKAGGSSGGDDRWLMNLTPGYQFLLIGF